MESRKRARRVAADLRRSLAQGGQPGVCDACGGELVLREADRPDPVRVRMEAYAANTAPLADFYTRRRLLLPIPADGTAEAILARTLHALKTR